MYYWEGHPNIDGNPAYLPVGIYPNDVLALAVEGSDERMPAEKPRASSLAYCSRRQAYAMVAAEVTDHPSPDSLYTAEQGRIMEDATIAALGRADIHIVNQQAVIDDPSLPFTGHIDGEVAAPRGERVGFEHKHLGRYSYKEHFIKGPEGAAPDYIAQMVAYGLGRGWDEVLYVVTSQDASSMRGEYTMNQRVKDPAKRWSSLPGWNPKMLIYRINLQYYYKTLAEPLLARASALVSWYRHSTRQLDAPDPRDIHREFDPEAVLKDGKVAFQCTYCPWQQRCKEDGPGGEKIPWIPGAGN